jgi:hypothetical protein
METAGKVRRRGSDQGYEGSGPLACLQYAGVGVMATLDGTKMSGSASRQSSVSFGNDRRRRPFSAFRYSS